MANMTSTRVRVIETVEYEFDVTHPEGISDENFTVTSNLQWITKPNQGECFVGVLDRTIEPKPTD